MGLYIKTKATPGSNNWLLLIIYEYPPLSPVDTLCGMLYIRPQNNFIHEEDIHYTVVDGATMVRSPG